MQALVCVKGNWLDKCFEGDTCKARATQSGRMQLYEMILGIPNGDEYCEYNPFYAFSPDSQGQCPNFST